MNKIHKEINPNNKPIVAIHYRGNDPWKRHPRDGIKSYNDLLFRLLKRYPDHLFVLLGESWQYFHHPRIKYLSKFINPKQIYKNLKEYTSCLKYILSAYFCRDADILFIGISGFTLFLESIRPLNLMPPIPLFWTPKVFSGIDTCLEIIGYGTKNVKEIVEYQMTHPDDLAFQYDIHHFIYYSRDEKLLKPYCMDYPNSINKVLTLLQKLEEKYTNPKRIVHHTNVPAISSFNPLKISFIKMLYSMLINFKWSFSFQTKRIIKFIKYKAKGLIKKISKLF